MVLKNDMCLILRLSPSMDKNWVASGNKANMYLPLCDVSGTSHCHGHLNWNGDRGKAAWNQSHTCPDSTHHNP